MSFHGLAEEIEHPTRFQSVHARLLSLDRVTQRNEMRRLGASPDVLVGSVHAITEQGEIMIASAVGSQLGPAASGAGMVIWVVGTQKRVSREIPVVMLRPANSDLSQMCPLDPLH